MVFAHLFFVFLSFGFRDGNVVSALLRGISELLVRYLIVCDSPSIAVQHE